MSLPGYSHQFRGIPRSEIIQYFQNIGLRQVTEGIFQTDYGRIVIGETEQCCLGSVKISEVKITFCMDEAAYQELIKPFRLQFLRAGG